MIKRLILAACLLLLFSTYAQADSFLDSFNNLEGADSPGMSGLGEEMMEYKAQRRDVQQSTSSTPAVKDYSFEVLSKRGSTYPGEIVATIRCKCDGKKYYLKYEKVISGAWKWNRFVAEFLPSDAYGDTLSECAQKICEIECY